MSVLTKIVLGLLNRKPHSYVFIRNSQTSIHNDKHPRAIESWETYQPLIMNDYPNLSDRAIVHYIRRCKEWAYHAISWELGLVDR